jgi:site-specific recombinase XerD
MDGKCQATIEWIEKRLNAFNETKSALEHAIEAYLEWMAQNAYARSTQRSYKRTLNRFLSFIQGKRYSWDDIFTRRTLNCFKNIGESSQTHAITGLSRYLYARGKIARPIRVGKALPMLPVIYEDYLLYRKTYRHASDRQANHIRRVLYAFDRYCQRNNIRLRSLKIDPVDAFQNECFNDFAGTTRRVYRTYLRGFLSYLYIERQVLTVDLAPLVTGRREYGKAKPPKFLRPAEVQQLFASLDPCSASGIRTYALVHLAYSMGLRPMEISRLRLEDMGFSRQLMRVTVRKGDNPIELPIPKHTLKAVAAYIIGARPKTKHRRLFLNLQPPYRPMTPNAVGCRISFAMKRAGLDTSAYWLRHTYAQNLLEAGASVFEIKEMLGHDTIESTHRYLQVHTKLMRQVLFDETI